MSLTSMSSAPSGPSLVNADGTWSWGAAAAGRPNEYFITQNGVNNGVGLFMQVTNGKFYVQSASSAWFVWNGGSYGSSSPPGAADGCLIQQSAAGGGTPAGTYTDVSVSATQASASNSPKTQALTLNAPSGGGGTPPTPPAQATVANFDTCIICMDFTASTGGVWVNGSAVAGKNGADASTWLDCAGSSSPLWFKGVNQPEHSSDFLCPDIVNDGAGNPRVLRATMGPQSTWSVGTGLLLYSGTPGVGGLMAPTNLYIESAGWYKDWPSDNGYGTTFWMGGGGQIPGNLYNNLEYDAFEINSPGPCCGSGGMSSNFHSWIAGDDALPGNWYGSYPPNYSGYLPTSGYHVIGMRITSNGSDSIYKCMWLDGIFQDCAHASPDGSGFRSSQLSDGTSRMQIYLTGPGNFFGPTSGNMTYLTKYLYAWSCSSWQTTACSTPGNPDPGGY